MDVSKFTLTAALTLLLSHTVLAGYRRVCYHTNWSQYRNGIGKFKPRDIDPHLCTHLVYSFAQIQNDELATYEWNDEQLYQEFNDLKKANPDLITLLAVGGWNQASTHFSPMVSSPQKMDKFVRTSVDFLRKYGFDGLDLDWEYPALRGGASTDKDNFGTLCKKLRIAYEEEARTTGKERLLVTAAVAAGKNTVDAAYDVIDMATYLDFISIMTYDLHGGGWEKFTGHNSPLYNRSGEVGDQRYLNINWAAKYWASKGVPREQLNIGLATYGRGFNLVDPNNHGMGAAATGPNPAGPYTREPGYLSYYEICDMISKGGTVYREPEQLVPYYVNGKTWVGFDDEQSISTKVAWLVNEGFGGAIVWALPLDDFNMVCASSSRRFPLVSRMKDDLIAAEGGVRPTQAPTMAPVSTAAPVTTAAPVNTEAPVTTAAPVNTEAPVTTAAPVNTAAPVTTAAPGNMCYGKTDGYYLDPQQCSRYFRCVGGEEYKDDCEENPDPTSAPTVAPTVRPTTNSPGGVFTCTGTGDGDYAHPTDCSKFFKCANGVKYTFQCAPGTLYDKDTGTCQWAVDAKC